MAAINRKSFKFSCLLFFAAVVTAFLGCDGNRESVPDNVYLETALEFTRTLAAREYVQAHNMASSSFKKSNSLESMAESFERIIPTDWGDTEPMEAHFLDSGWFDSRASGDVKVYVSIYGDVYSEALVLSFSFEDEGLKISTVEYGRP